jgi:hypothetical protein
MGPAKQQAETARGGFRSKHNSHFREKIKGVYRD